MVPEYLFSEIENLFNSEDRVLSFFGGHVNVLYYFKTHVQYRYYLGSPGWLDKAVFKFKIESAVLYLSEETFLRDPVRWFFISVMFHVMYNNKLTESEKETDLMLFSYLRNLNDNELKSLEGPLVDIFFNRAYALCELNYRFWR